MKLNLEKISNIYGESILYELKDNLDDLVSNMQYLQKLGFNNIYDILESYPYMFLLSEDIFIEKVNKLVKKIGIEYLSILNENETLWEEIENDI